MVNRKSMQWPLINKLAWRTHLVAPLRGNVLEIGCGYGPNFKEYHSSCQVSAIEPDSERRTEAELEATKVRASICVYQAWAEDLPFPDRYFDYVLCCLVLCSVQDQPMALAEIRRVLKPDGDLVLLEHVIPTTPALAWFAHKITPVWSSALCNCHPNRDTLATLSDLGWDIRTLRRHTCIVRGTV